MIEAARQYYANGWSPIPLRYASKAPALREGHGLLGRRATAQELRSFEWGGVGIVTGSLSGIVVLDVDGQEGLSSLLEYGLEPPMTMTAKTPNGWHYYFKYTDDIARNYIRSIGAGLDVKSNGGYVVAPPSIHPTGELYRWADEMGPGEVELLEPPTWMKERVSEAGNYSTPWTFGETEWGEGNRNTNFASLAGTLFSRGFPSSVVYSAVGAVNQEHCSPPLSDAEIQEIVDKIGRYYEQG